MAGYVRRRYIKSLCGLHFNLLFYSLPEEPRWGPTRTLTVRIALRAAQGVPGEPVLPSLGSARLT